MGIMGYRVVENGFLIENQLEKRDGQGNGAWGYTGVFRDQSLLVLKLMTAMYKTPIPSSFHTRYVGSFRIFVSYRRDQGLHDRV